MTDKQRQYLITEKRVDATSKEYVKAWDWRDAQKPSALNEIRNSLSEELAQPTEQPEPVVEPAKVTEKPVTQAEPKAEVITEPSPIDVTNVVKPAPKFPTDDAFLGKMGVFWNAYGNRSEVCPAFHFASALAQVSMACGRKFRIEGNVGRYYANWYQAIVGTSFISSKSKVLEDTTDMIDDTFFDIDDYAIDMWKQTDNFPSTEAATEFLQTHEHISGKYEPLEFYESPNGIRAFAHFDELRSLFIKSRMSGSEGLIPFLTRIFKCPKRLLIPTRNNKSKVKAEYPVLNIMGCTTMDWFEKSLDTSDIEGGFVNRFVFYLHDQQPLYPFMKKPDDHAVNEWSNMLKLMAEKSLISDRIFDLDDETTQSYEKWYVENKTAIIDNPNDLVSIAGARVIEHALKLSLVYSILDNDEKDNKIHLKAWESAMKVAEYWKKVTVAMFSTLAVDKFDKLEKTILQKLAELGNEATRTSLRRKMSGRTNTADFNRAIEALLIAEVIMKTEGKPQRIVRIDE